MFELLTWDWSIVPHILRADPITILAALSAVTTAAGSVMAGNQQAAALNAQAQFNENAAQTKLLEGAANESAIRINNRRLLGRQIASVGASGLELSGSPLDFTLDSLVDAEMDALTARYQGEAAAQSLNTQASMDRAGAKSARTNGYLGGAAALISGGMDVYGKMKTGGGSKSGGFNGYGSYMGVGR